MSLKGRVVLALVSIICILGVAATVDAASVATTRYMGKTYTVDVLTAGSSATVYFRVKANTCTAGDIYIGTLTRSTKTVKKNETLRQVAAGLCSIKRTYDTGKMIAGCTATAGSAICLLASVPTGGTTAVLCSASVVYTASSGLKDCVLGVSGAIASYLGHERNWSAFAAM